jgi:Pyridoxamine 5'-phosphate oxidase
VAVTWGEFAKSAPEIAQFGVARFAEINVSTLATVRTDGWPRLHPFEPVLAGGHLFLFTYRTPAKVAELREDGRYTAHNMVTDTEGGNGEFSIRGVVRPVEGGSPADVAWDAVKEKGWKRNAGLIVWELLVDEASAIVWTDGQPQAKRWLSSH